MKIASLKNIPANPVEMEGAVGCRMRLAISPRDGAPNFAMRAFEIASGGHTPLHKHPFEHEVYVIDGWGTVWRDGKEVPIKPGDVLYIPADEQHQFTNAGDKPFQFICLIPAKFQKC